MGTLYDLLGALPGDDAESLRTAFRKAAKAKHPDINPDDPDAALRFRELVRAYDILTDAEQRATYDELLTIALRPPASKSMRLYGGIRKLASNTIAATIISGVLIGGYALFGHLPTAPGAAEIVTGATASRLEEIAAAALPDPSAQNEPGGRREGTKSTDETTVTAAVATAVSDGGARTTGNADPGLAASGGKSHRGRRLAFREGDTYRAISDPDLAVRHDPGLSEATVDRGAVFNRAFADLARAKRITDRGQPRIPLPVPRKVSPVRVRAPARWAPMIAATTP